MSYEVEITRDKIRLKYINSDIIVEPKSHLSWGEKIVSHWHYFCLIA